MDEGNWHLIVNFLFPFYHHDNYSTGNAINFLVLLVCDTSKIGYFYDQKCFSTLRKKVEQAWKYIRTTVRKMFSSMVALGFFYKNNLVRTPTKWPKFNNMSRTT